MKFCLAFIVFLCGTAVFSQTTKPHVHETQDYKIQFPSVPEDSSFAIPSAIGELLLNMNTLQPETEINDENLMYAVIETTYPDSLMHSDMTEKLDGFFRGAINGAVKNVNGKLLKETTVNYGKYPARTIEIDFGEGSHTIKVIIVLKANKVIMLQTMTEIAKYPNAAGNKFFDSFQLK